MRAQPDARLLFLLRDGRDVVDSELASFAVGGWQERSFAHMRGVAETERLDFVIRSAHQWLWRTEVVEAAFAEHRGPKHMLRYEDLLREPERHLGELFEWLGVPIEPADVEAAVEALSLRAAPAHRGPDAAATASRLRAPGGRTCVPTSGPRCERDPGRRSCASSATTDRPASPASQSPTASSALAISGGISSRCSEVVEVAGPGTRPRSPASPSATARLSRSRPRDEAQAGRSGRNHDHLQVRSAAPERERRLPDVAAVEIRGPLAGRGLRVEREAVVQEDDRVGARSCASG